MPQCDPSKTTQRLASIVTRAAVQHSREKIPPECVGAHGMLAIDGGANVVIGSCRLGSIDVRSGAAMTKAISVDADDESQREASMPQRP